jgi:hypothetical protein
VKGILIDPVARSVEYLESDSFELEELYSLIGADTLDFAHPFGRMETLLVDDNGLGKELESFRIDGYRWPIYGRAVILGRDASGETRSTGLTVESVYEVIKFP